MGVRQEQKEQRKEAILVAALDLFVKKGFEKTTIADIAQAVNMSIGLLFHYFESKQVLYEELIKIGVQGPGIDPGLEHVKGIEYFELLAASVLSSVDSQPIIAKMFVLMTRENLNPSQSKRVTELLEDVSNLIETTTEQVRIGQASGDIRPGNPEALGVMFMQALSGVMLYCALMPEGPRPQAEWIVDSIRARP